MTNEPETLYELLDMMESPPYRGLLNSQEQDEMITGWLIRHFGVEIEEVPRDE